MTDIVIDFDGTCVTHEFPEIGKDIGAQRVLKKLVERGHRLILFTMRSDNGSLPLFTVAGIENVRGDFLTQAVEWFEKNEIPLFGIQENPEQKSWTNSPKAYGQIIIDDSALGCPLTYVYGRRPYVDWESVESMLKLKGLIHA